MSDSGMRVEADPPLDDDTAAAIMAAYQALWPKPGRSAVGAPTPTTWRFAGRWWMRDGKAGVAQH